MEEGDMFLMERYLGSDEENCSGSEVLRTAKDLSDKNNHVENESSEPKQKRRKIKSSECSKFEVESDIRTENSFLENKIMNGNIESIEPSTSLKKKKVSKRKKPKNGEVSKKGIQPGAPVNRSENSEKNFQVIGTVQGKNDEKIKTMLPKWLSNPTLIGIDLHGQETPISELSYLDDASKINLKSAGIKFLFPVQQSVIPWLMQSNKQCLSIRPSDLCVSAPTGSGKTLAFVLPIVQSLKNRIVCAIRAIVVLPVSELAFQVYKVFQAFVKGTDLKVTLITGKKSFTYEQNQLVKKTIRKSLSLADIVIATPGRLLDHIYRTDGFCLKQLRYLVIDEADGMMYTVQSGWLKSVEEAVYHDSHKSSCVCYAVGGKRLSIAPSTACSLGYIDQPLQKLLYSATLSHDPEKLHSLSLYKPKLFTAQVESDDFIGKCPIPKDLTLQAIICKDGTKPMVLCHYLKEKKFQKVLCFTQSVERAQRLYFILFEMGLNVREISSNNTSIQRKIILEQFGSGKVDIIVCSDMVARGIDIGGVDCVVSYDAPAFLKTYVHRIGRTARAGRKGVGVTLLTQGEKATFFKKLESAEMSLPELINIEDADLEMYIDTFTKSLSVVDSKMKKLKNGIQQKMKRFSEKFAK